MSALPYTTYSRIDLNCTDLVIVARSVVRVDNSTEPVDQVDGIEDGVTTSPISYADAAAFLASVNAWVADAGSDASTVWTRLELSCSNNKVTVAGFVRHGTNYPNKSIRLLNATTAPTTLAAAHLLLQAAHARVVAARGL